MNDKRSIEEAADRVVQLEAELESAGLVSTEDKAVGDARAALHTWIDTVVGVVASPGVGRVTLIHADGRRSAITSPELPYLLSRPVTFDIMED